MAESKRARAVGACVVAKIATTMLVAPV